MNTKMKMYFFTNLLNKSYTTLKIYFELDIWFNVVKTPIYFFHEYPWDFFVDVIFAHKK